MTVFKTFLATLVLSVELSGTVWAQTVTADTVVATVGDTTITVGHMIALGTTLPEQERRLPLDVLFQGILERLIQQEAIAQSQPNPSKFALLKIENERRSLLASEVVNNLAETVQVTPETIQMAYDRRFENFTPGPEYNASHILLDTEEAAKEVIQTLNNGADFTKIAIERSVGPSGPSGGNLGWFALGRMVPEFETVVVAMEKGTVSAPVKTKHGWHVILLNDVRQPNVPTLDDLRTELEQEVWREQLQSKIDELIDAADVSMPDNEGIDPSVLSDFSLIQQ